VRKSALLAALPAVAFAGCGFNVQSPDLFLLTRTGQGKPLTMLVNDGGTISCNRGKARKLTDALLIQARAIASDLDPDAKVELRIAPARNSVALYTIKLQNGTISFPDTAAAKRHELAETELFAAQAAQQYCSAT
jgi:hypothetical protein